MKKIMVILIIYCIVIPFQSYGSERLSPRDAAVLSTYLPPGGFQEGWALKNKPTAYSSKNLYELIDGEAEMYFLYGFKKAVSGIYTRLREKSSILTVDLFQMESPLMAFGIYSTYRSADSSFFPIGAESFGEPDYLYLYKGNIFARIYCSTASIKGPVFAAAKLIAAAIPGNPSPPPQLSLLAEKNKVAHSEKLIARGFLGLDDHPPAIEAEYRVHKNTIKGFIIQSPRRDKSEALFKRILATLDKKSMKEKALGSRTAHYGQTQYHKGLCLCAEENIITGAYELDSYQECSGILSDMLGKAQKK